ncbi:MAG: HRDC domain-containing protein [Bacteroidales bacterium]|nr:HRDC domain-containing protein [Bacteroidales bacterium]
MGIKFINSEYSISIFRNLFSNEKLQDDIDINKLIELVKYGRFRKEIEKLRSVKSKTEYDKIKRENLPCVTVSGSFDKRNSEGLVKHSGLIQIDFDNVEDYDSVFKQLCNDTYTYLCFRSPGGKGIKVIVKINPSSDTHLSQFRALDKYYSEHYKSQIDKYCKDIARCMLISFDPDLFCNPFSDVYPELFVQEVRSTSEPPRKPAYQKSATNADSLNETVESIISSLEEGKIDLTADFNDWWKIGYALCSAFGENGRRYFHRISSMYPYYSFDEVDKKYTQLLKMNTGRIGIGTLIWMAKQRGIEICHKPVSIPKPYSYTGKLSEAAEQKVEYQQSAQRGYVTGNIEKIAPDVQVKKAYEANEVKESNEKRLIQQLKDLRLKISKEKHISAFRVFYNSTLDELVKVKPKTVRDLYNIKGLSDKKIKWFGNEIIKLFNSINE